jgi:hypothetical protein
MTIEAQLPGGVTLQFPDGTPDAIVQGAVKQQLSKQPDSASQTPESKLGLTPAPPPPSTTGPGPDAWGRYVSPDGAPVAGPQPPPGPGPEIWGHYGSPDEAPPQLSTTPAGHIIEAAKEGWREAPTLLPPESGQIVTPGSGLGVNQPLVTAGNAVLGAGNALLRGAQAGAYELLAPYSVPLARDVAALPEAFPTGDYGQPSGPRTALQARNTVNRATPQIPGVPQAVTDAITSPFSARRPITVQEITDAIRRSDINPSVQQNQMMPGEPSPERSPEPTPAQEQQQPAPTETSQPQPGAAGAQITPAAELGLTPAEEIAYRSTAEGNKLLEPQEPGVRDDKQYLPGEKINEAEASQDVLVARNLKSLRQQTPVLDAQMTADENFNNNLRYNEINKAIPGQVQIKAAQAARTEAMQTAEPKVFANATDADVQPIVKDIQDILNDPKNRQNTQLGQYVRPLIDRLVNPDGTPKITDARELWGWRQDVQHLTSKAAQIGDPNLSRVSGILGRVLDTTDDRIEAAAPGYKAQLRDDYRTRSQQIDAMEALNAERFKLFDSQNKPNYNAVQSLMRRIADARQEGDPYEPFTHVTQDTLDHLWNIRDSMRRTQAADRLAAPKGSPTSQNMGDALRMAGRMALQGAAPAIGATIGSAVIPIPGVGPALGLAAGAAVNHLFSERAMAQRLAEGQTMLHANRLGPQSAP